MKTQLSLATPLALKLNVEVEATVKGVDEMTGDEGDSSNSVLARTATNSNSKYADSWCHLSLGMYQSVRKWMRMRI